MLWRKSERTQLLHVSVQSLNCQSRPFFWARHTQCTGTTEILCIWSERIPAEQIWALWQFSLLTFRDPAGPVTKQFPTLQRPFAAASRMLQFGKPCRTRRLLSVPGRHRGQALLPELVFKPSSHRWAPTTGNKFPRTCDVCNCEIGKPGHSSLIGSSKARGLHPVPVLPFFVVQSQRVCISYSSRKGKERVGSFSSHLKYHPPTPASSLNPHRARTARPKEHTGLIRGLTPWMQGRRN